MNDSEHIVVFGAGSIGRGLIGQLAASAGFKVVFVEPFTRLREQLAAQGRYEVQLTGRLPETFEVSNFSVLAPEDNEALAEAICMCHFAVTAAGGAHLKSVAASLADAMQAREATLPVLLCENWPHADVEMAGFLRNAGVADKAFGCVPSSVERMVRPAEGLDLVGESCETLFIEGSKWPEPRPAIPGFDFVENLEPYYKRKLYTNNGGHALLAYEGALFGFNLLWESLENAAVRRELEAFLEVAARALSMEYGVKRAELAEHIDNLLRHRFPNKALADNIKRVGRDPLRKLGPAERLVGLVRLMEKHGLDLGPVCAVIGAALHYDDPEDAECLRMKQMMAEGGAERVLVEVCGFQPADEAYALTLKSYANFQHVQGKGET